MVNTLRLAVSVGLIVVLLGGGSLYYEFQDREDTSIIVSVDAELNGQIDERVFEYRTSYNTDTKLLNESFVVRIANLGKTDVNNIQIKLKHTPENAWYNFEKVEKTFGDSKVFYEKEYVKIDKLGAGMTISIKYDIGFNTTLIKINNINQDRSVIIFEIDHDESNKPEIRSYTVRIFKE